jgi:hypothetical protein
VKPFFAVLNFVGGELKLIRIHQLEFQFAHGKHCQSASGGRREVGKVDWNIPLAETEANEEKTMHKCISSSTSSAVSM